MSEKRRRFKIYRDEAKERLTNHWDWDYMGYDSTNEEFVQSSPPVTPDRTTESTPSPRNFLDRVRNLFLFRRRGV